MGYIEAFNSVHAFSSSPSNFVQLRLSPLLDWLKVNFDASVMPDRSEVGLGCSLRGDSDRVLRAISSFNDGCSSVLMADLMAIATGLVMAVNFGSSRMVVESDSKGTIDLIFLQGLF